MRNAFKRFKKAHHGHAAAIKRVSRHPAFAIPLVTGSFLILLTIVVVVLFNGGSAKLQSTDTHIVIINHDKIEQTVPTRATTVSEVLKRFNIKINQGDVVEPDVSTEIVTDNFRVNVYRAVPVTIVDNGHKQFAFSAASTPRSIVKQAGINVFPEDKLELLPTDNFLSEASIGERVVISRATPVNVNIYGTPVVMRSRATTVGDLLAERGLKLESKDYVQPGRNTPVTANLQIYLLRQGQKVLTEEATTDMPTEIVEDASLSFGTTALRQQGQPGKKIITYL
ncbi:MAG: ubiquitin-like domain-containing protein, partial [Candidatus Saccharimonadales bacterium]